MTDQNLPATQRPKPVNPVVSALHKAMPEFQKALPAHIPVEKFVRTVQTALTMNPDMQRAAQASPAAMQSLMVACTKAATDGLILDGREAALVSFKGQVTYMPMVAGLMKKARNSGMISTIDAIIVREFDSFRYNPATDDAPDHNPEWFGDRGKAIGVYAVVRMKDGTTQVEIMNHDQIKKIAAQSKNGAQYDPVNGKNFEEWWRKTVIRRISKYLPSSSDRDEFLQAVERLDDGFEFEAEADGPTVPSGPVPKKRGAAADKLKNVTPQTQSQPKAAPKPAPVEDAQPVDDEIPYQGETPHDPETGEVMDGEVMDGEVMPPASEDIQKGDDF